MALIENIETASDKMGRFAVAIGGAFNSVIKFMAAAFGPNSGKLLSIIIVVFTLTICIWSFFGQISQTPDCGSTCTPEQMELKRTVYKDAIQSVSIPIGILVGAFPTLVGLGIMARKYNERKASEFSNGNGGAAGGVANNPPASNTPTEVTELSY